MNKIAILLFTGIVLSTGAMAQTKAQAQDNKADQKELKNTIIDKKEDKHEVGSDLAHLKIKSALRERREVRRHRRSITKQGEHLENHGVAHPITKAKHEAKAEKEMKESKQ
jgi:hypothetical protein